MKTNNASVRSQVEQRRSLFKLLRRSDIVMQMRQHMVAKGIKSADLAERLGVSEANISRWLKGNQNLGLDTLFSLADAIEEPLTLLIGQYEVNAPTNSNSVEARVQDEWEPAEAITVENNVFDLSRYASLKRALNEPRFTLAQNDKNSNIEDEANGRSAVAA
jgi:transcriptional regulator with XRE-family HTH domain